MKINENQRNEVQWKSMKNQCKSMKIDENQWKPMKINEISWKSMKNLWKSMKFDENQWKPIETNTKQ